MKILFIVPYPIASAPSQRFRFEQYFEALKKEGIQYEVQSFIDEATWDILYKKGFVLKKIFGILKGFLRRKLLFFKLRQYHRVFIHREAAPIGPPIFELMLAKVFRKKIIYDFDDAIWLENVSESNKIVSKLKWYSKVSSIIKWSEKISCGNDFLCGYAKMYNKNVVLNPTTIDMFNLHNETKNQNSDKFVIGWTGTHSTIKYLEPIVPVIEQLEMQFDFDFLVISNRKPDWNLKSLKYLDWQKETEVADLLKMNIGLMPIPDDDWAKGKCGFKALQYMSLGIPALVSPVAVNKEIVDNGINGYWCNSNEEWKTAITTLIQDADLRVKMGVAAKEKIKNHYSVESNTVNFLNLFK
jgi:glycosyltransferase involved in cell wall biosynthesis